MLLLWPQFSNGVQLLVTLYNMQPTWRLWEFTEELQVCQHVCAFVDGSLLEGRSVVTHTDVQSCVRRPHCLCVPPPPPPLLLHPSSSSSGLPAANSC